MQVYRGNHLSALLDDLARIVGRPEPLASPFAEEIVLIQSAGMERYLSRELSRRLGIAFGIAFPFPRSFIEALFRKTLGDDEQAAHYEREALQLRLFQQLGKSTDPAVARYLEGDVGGQERLALARALAHAFDQYAVYRPTLLAAWASGDAEGDFQADLWRALSAEIGPHWFAERLRRFLALPDSELRVALPHRLSVVGGPGLPPLFVQLLARIGRVIPVHLFSFSVTSEYLDPNPGAGDELVELGAGLHPLLASWAKVAADYLAILESVEHEEKQSYYVLPPPTTLLGALQGDIISACRRSPEKRLPAAFLRDGSLSFQSCHSPLREVEALRGQLLHLFSSDPSLRPEDVIVLLPDVSGYAPLIHAVMGNVDETVIPYRVADRGAALEAPTVRSFLQILGLSAKRLKASEVLDVLQGEAVRQQMGMDARAFERISEWVRLSAARWGADGAHQESLGVPGMAQNSWSCALRRLLLGLVTCGEAEEFEGVIPVFGLDPTDAPLLGVLYGFVKNLEGLLVALAQPLALPEFVRICREALPQFFGVAGAAEHLPLIHRALTRMEELTIRTQFTETLSASAAIAFLRAQLEQVSSGSEFLTGGVTFCEFLPLRTIPFRVIAVLGLSDGEFPRKDAQNSLNRLTETPKVGDRSLRDDDKYLFLETLLAARQKLIVSFVGRNIQDNSVRPPSPLVSELMGVLGEMVEGEWPREKLWRELTVQHPLQPFSPQYFDGQHPELKNYSSEDFVGARALVESSGRAPQEAGFFVGSGLRAELPLEVVLVELERFFRSPAAAYLDRFGIAQAEVPEELEDREPITLDPLTKHSLGEKLLEAWWSGRDIEVQKERGRGLVPVGAPGDVLLDEVVEGALAVHEIATSIWGGQKPSQLDVDVQTSSFRLTGRVPGIAGDDHVLCTVGLITPSRQIRAWLRHLALCASGFGVTTHMVGRHRTRERPEQLLFRSIDPETAQLELGDLIELYREGLTQPLRFDLEAAFRWKSRKSQGAPGSEIALMDRALLLSRSAWALKKVFGPVDPLGLQASPGPMGVPFPELVEQVLGPLFDCREDASRALEADL